MVRMRTLGSVLGVSKQTEMLMMSFLTLWTNVFDMALFELGTSLEQVWNIPLEITKFTPEAQNFIKIVLSGVVFVRTFSLHLYIAFVIAMFWPITFRTHPTLMLPWLTVSAIKNLGAGIVTFVTGLYTCMIYGPFRPACVNFLGSQILDMSPSFYMWIIGISLYRDLRQPKPVNKTEVRISEEEEINMALRRRKVKSMVDEEILREQFESRRKFIGNSAVEVKDIFVPSAFEETIRRKISRSLDSLLDAMNAEADILELEEFEPIEDGLKLSEKTAKLLGITMSEINEIKENRQTDLKFSHCPVKAQKQQINLSNTILKHESPLKLLTESSLYTPSTKPVRPTKSELKSPKDFLNLKSPSDFMQSVPEYELRLSNYSQDPKSDVTETIFEASNVSSSIVNQIKLNENDSVTESEESIKRPESEETIKCPGSEEITKPPSLITVIHVRNSQNSSSVPSKKTSEIGCQVCTLSRKILNASAQEVSEKLSHMIPKKTKRSRTIDIKPPSNTFIKRNQNPSRPSSAYSQNRTSPPNIFVKSPSLNSHNFLTTSTERISPREPRSYLSIHLNKLERSKTVESKLGLDKFGIGTSSNSATDGIMFSSTSETEENTNDTPTKKFKNITFKFE